MPSIQPHSLPSSSSSSFSFSPTLNRGASSTPTINNNNNNNNCNSAGLSDTMRRNARTAFLFVSIAFFAFTFYSLHIRLHRSITTAATASATAVFAPRLFNSFANRILPENVDRHNYVLISDPDWNHARHMSSIKDAAQLNSVESVSILFPAWEVLVVVSPESGSNNATRENRVCLLQNNSTSPARFAGVLPFTKRDTFKCILPNSVRRLRPFYQPLLIDSSDKEPYFPEFNNRAPELLRWTFLAYESFSTDDDVVLFVKGVNNRQGIGRSPSQLNCVFFAGDSASAVEKTAVTSSSQEVFRCRHPEPSALAALSSVESGGVKISLEFAGENRTVPSVARYTPRHTLESNATRSLICASTMVYNVAKFLKEWVMYHSSIGIDRFLLYDNDSDDGLQKVVNELNGDGYDVRTVRWVWPKTQEAGFAHATLYGKDLCDWMVFVDVDEFVFSPYWNTSSQPSKYMVKSFVQQALLDSPPIGEISLKCYEFGPSNQKSHPIRGVTQGYTCRKRMEQRHKSFVLLDAVDNSLLNVIHHFKIKEGYRSKNLRLEHGAINHYKYQAWPEFKTKFRRRVSAYVVDWTQEHNPKSKDRTPGLGFKPVEPEGWAEKFCEVEDHRLRELTWRWFGQGHRMAWQR